MLKRLKRIVELSRKDPQSVDALLDEQIRHIPDEGGAFFGPGTAEEYQQQLDEDSGMRPWLEHLKKL